MASRDVVPSEGDEGPSGGGVASPFGSDEEAVAAVEPVERARHARAREFAREFDASGRSAAFEVFVAERMAQLTAHARACLGRHLRELAEDVVQTALLRTWRAGVLDTSLSGAYSYVRQAVEWEARAEQDRAYHRREVRTPQTADDDDVEGQWLPVDIDVDVTAQVVDQITRDELEALVEAGAGLNPIQLTMVRMLLDGEIPAGPEGAALRQHRSRAMKKLREFFHRLREENQW